VYGAPAGYCYRSECNYGSLQRYECLFFVIFHSINDGSGEVKTPKGIQLSVKHGGGGKFRGRSETQTVRWSVAILPKISKLFAVGNHERRRHNDPRVSSFFGGRPQPGWGGARRVYGRISCPRCVVRFCWPFSSNVYATRGSIKRREKYSPRYYITGETVGDSDA